MLGSRGAGTGRIGFCTPDLLSPPRATLVRQFSNRSSASQELVAPDTGIGRAVSDQDLSIHAVVHSPRVQNSQPLTEPARVEHAHSVAGRRLVVGDAVID